VVEAASEVEMDQAMLGRTASCPVLGIRALLAGMHVGVASGVATLTIVRLPGAVKSRQAPLAPALSTFLLYRGHFVA
jgi:hypothetical protein